MNKVYPCSILPADGLQVVSDGRNLRARIQFGSGTGHSTPVMLSEEQVLQLAYDISVWSAQRNAGAKPLK